MAAPSRADYMVASHVVPPLLWLFHCVVSHGKWIRGEIKFLPSVNSSSGEMIGLAVLLR
jgi:hypothetical protein